MESPGEIFPNPPGAIEHRRPERLHHRADRQRDAAEVAQLRAVIPAGVHAVGWARCHGRDQQGQGTAGKGRPKDQRMVESTENDPGSISISSGDVRSLRALLEIANDKSCAEATRELARLGLTGYLSSILGEPPVIEDGGACD